MTFTTNSPIPGGGSLHRAGYTRHGMRRTGEETHLGWFAFPAALDDPTIIGNLIAEGYSPEGYRSPVISAYGGAWKVVARATITRKGSRALVRQTVTFIR